MKGTSRTVVAASALLAFPFTKAVDDIGAGIQVGAEFAAQIMAKDFHRGVELLAEKRIASCIT